MSRTYRYPDHRAGRCHPRLERLENRLALSSLPTVPIGGSSVVGSPFAAGEGALELGPYLTIVATDPAPADALQGTIDAVRIQFDRTLDPAMLGLYDVLIQVEVGGEWVDPFNGVMPPAESVGGDGTLLVLTPASPLGPGRYRIVLPTGSFLMGTDGSMFDDPGYDQVLAEFTVTRLGATLDDASPIAGVGGDPIAVGGALDLAADPGAVALYRFTVPQGHHWRFGAEVASQAMGGTLQSTLTLFDARGRVVATSSHGRPGSPNDAYLFAGLEPGTYYVGVSGYGNVPGLPGGYDPVDGTTGTSTAPVGGSFQLNLVADPADSPTRLLGCQFNWGDRLSASPTGLTLTFSGLLDLASMRGEGASGFVLIDDRGQTHTLTLVGLSEPAAQYYFLLDEPLPAGRYTLRVADDGATDLAGLTPVGSAPLAAGLASFDVAARANVVADPSDLGGLYADIEAGRSFDATVDPGTAVNYRFVALAEGLYRFSVASSTAEGRLQMRLFGAPGRNTYGLGPERAVVLYLPAGTYFLQILNDGPQVARVTWQVKQQTPWDALLENGLGQGPALGMRLVQRSDAPSSLSPPGAAASAGPVGAASGGAVSGPFGPGSGPGGGALAAANSIGAAGAGAALPGGLVLTLGNSPVGRPSTDAEHVAAVGPAPGGSVALASRGNGLLQGIGLGQSVDGRLTWPDEVEPGPDAPEPASPTTAATVGPETVVVAASEASVDGAMVVPSRAEVEGDESLAAVAADWMARIGRSTLAFFTPGGDAPAEAEAPLDAAATRALLARDDAEPSALEGRGRVEEAHFDAPLIVGVVSVMAMRYHQPMLRWVRQHQGKPHLVRRRGSTLPARGPHTRP